jgi:hypothetical protein
MGGAQNEKDDLGVGVAAVRCWECDWLVAGGGV